MAAAYAQESADEIRLTNGEWPPYMSGQLPDGGLVSRIVTLAFANQNISVSYEFFPWSRALFMARSGALDGSVAWTCNPDMLEDFRFSDPILAHHYVLFHRKSMDFDWNNVEDLAPYRMGVTQDYNYGEAFEQAEERDDITTDRTTSDAGNFRKLAAGRIDLFPMEPVVGRKILKSLGLEDEITLHPQPLQSDHLYVIISRRSPYAVNYQKSLNKGLSSLRQSGQLSELVHETISDKVIEQLPLDTAGAPCVDA